MSLVMSESVAVDVTADAANLDPPLIAGIMLIVQSEVMLAFPALEPFRIERPIPAPQDPGPNGVFIQAASAVWLQNAAPPSPDGDNPWDLWIQA